MYGDNKVKVRKRRLCQKLGLASSSSFLMRRVQVLKGYQGHHNPIPHHPQSTIKIKVDLEKFKLMCAVRSCNRMDGWMDGGGLKEEAAYLLDQVLVGEDMPLRSKASLQKLERLHNALKNSIWPLVV